MITVRYFLLSKSILMKHNESLNTHLPTFTALKSRPSSYTDHGLLMCHYTR